MSCYYNFANCLKLFEDICDRLWEKGSRLQLLRFKYQMIEQRIACALIRLRLVCTYHAIAVLRNAHLKIAKLGKVR